MMLDPLSISASISGLLTLAGSVLSSGYGYVGSVRGAPMELHRSLQEIAALKITLDQMSYLADPSKQSDEETQTMANMTTLFESGMFKDCSKILESVKSSIKRCEQHDGQRVNNVLRSAIWPFKEKETKASLDSLRGLGEAFSKALSIDTATLVQDTRKRVIEMQSDQHIEKRQRAAVDDKILAWKTEIGKRAEEQAQKQRTHEDQDLLEWLSPVDEQISHDAASGKHHQGTGTWIFQNSTFQKWLTGGVSRLWLHAKAGAGKTDLVSTIINSIINSASKEHTGTRKALAYFYCDFRDNESLDATNVIGSILRQLVSKLQSIPSSVRHLYNAYPKNRPPIFKQLYKIILEEIQLEFDQILVIIDGVDECTDRGHLLSIFEDAACWTPNNLKWLISSRREFDIGKALSGKPSICIQNDQVSEDVSIYVKSRIETDERLQYLPQTVKSKIAATLIAGAKGMFRWAECQLEALRGARSIQAINETLTNLPRGLDETYVRILQKIPPEDQELARRAFMWILCSRRPIEFSELTEAIITEEEIEGVRPEARLLDSREIIEICGGLISATAGKTMEGSPFERIKVTVSLTHYSVKEFLLSSRVKASYPNISKFSIIEASGHAYLARVCLTYLAFDEFRPMSGKIANDTEDLFERFPLLKYAYSYWAEHCNHGKHEFEGRTYERLFGGDVCHIPQLGSLIGHRKSPSHTFINQSALIVATTMGCLRLVEKVVAKGADVNERQIDLDRSVETRHFEAQNGDFLQTSIILLQYLCCHSKAKSVVERAVSRGYHDIVIFLIKSGASFNGFNSWGHFPRTASETVDFRMAKILLENGADPNSKLDGETPIERAVKWDEPEIVQLLLDHGADPHLGNALGIAKAYNCVKVIKLLENLGVYSKEQ